MKLWKGDDVVRETKPSELGWSWRGDRLGGRSPELADGGGATPRQATNGLVEGLGREESGGFTEVVCFNFQFRALVF